jgi:hypothetical protein
MTNVIVKSSTSDVALNESAAPRIIVKRATHVSEIVLYKTENG